jgi:hypothetical protein
MGSRERLEWAKLHGHAPSLEFYSAYIRKHDTRIMQSGQSTFDAMRRQMITTSNEPEESI